jgi:UDP-GlcNAc:undecaprenyl-phosphate GlcNAc-1-phosphate transferase
LGFLVFNFPPARIFMGDSGSLFLGFTLATLAVARRTQASNVFAVMLVPTLMFLLPIVDTTLVTITRLLRGQSPAQGGRDHTSHRLIAFGLTERQAVLFLYGIALVSGVAAAALEALDYDLSLVLVPLLLIALALFTAYLGRLKVVTAFAPKPGEAPATTTPQPDGSITRLMVNLTYKRRLFEMALDFVLIGLAYYLAFWLRLGLNVSPENMLIYLRSAPVALALAFLAFALLGVYRGVWRYVGVDDLLRYVGAAVGGVLPLALVLRFVYSPGPTAGQVLTLDFFLIYTIILFLGLAASRFSFQVLDRISSRQQKPNTQQQNILIYGAEDAGELALRWILRNPELGYRPVGFLDDDALRWERTIHGVDVLGGLDQLESLIASRHVEGVIIASAADPSSATTDKVLAICQKQGVWVRVLRLAFEPVAE